MCGLIDGVADFGFAKSLIAPHSIGCAVCALPRGSPPEPQLDRPVLRDRPQKTRKLPWLRSSPATLVLITVHQLSAQELASLPRPGPDPGRSRLGLIPQTNHNPGATSRHRHQVLTAAAASARHRRLRCVARSTRPRTTRMGPGEDGPARGEPRLGTATARRTSTATAPRRA